MTCSTGSVNFQTILCSSFYFDRLAVAHRHLLRQLKEEDLRKLALRVKKRKLALRVNHLRKLAAGKEAGMHAPMPVMDESGRESDVAIVKNVRQHGQ